MRIGPRPHLIDLATTICSTTDGGGAAGGGGAAAGGSAAPAAPAANANATPPPPAPAGPDLAAVLSENQKLQKALDKASKDHAAFKAQVESPDYLKGALGKLLGLEKNADPAEAMKAAVAERDSLKAAQEAQAAAFARAARTHSVKLLATRLGAEDADDVAALFDASPFEVDPATWSPKDAAALEKALTEFKAKKPRLFKVEAAPAAAAPQAQAGAGGSGRPPLPPVTTPAAQGGGQPQTLTVADLHSMPTSQLRTTSLGSRPNGHPLPQQR
jgi:hypothetical protein